MVQQSNLGFCCSVLTFIAASTAGQPQPPGSSATKAVPPARTEARPGRSAAAAAPTSAETPPRLGRALMRRPQGGPPRCRVDAPLQAVPPRRAASGACTDAPPPRAVRLTAALMLRSKPSHLAALQRTPSTPASAASVDAPPPCCAALHHPPPPGPVSPAQLRPPPHLRVGGVLPRHRSSSRPGDAWSGLCGGGRQDGCWPPLLQSGGGWCARWPPLVRCRSWGGGRRRRRVLRQGGSVVSRGIDRPAMARTECCHHDWSSL